MANSEFFRNAAMLSIDEAKGHLTQAGFSSFELRQTIFRDPLAMKKPRPRSWRVRRWFVRCHKGEETGSAIKRHLTPHAADGRVRPSGGENKWSQ